MRDFDSPYTPPVFHSDVGPPGPPGPRGASEVTQAHEDQRGYFYSPYDEPKSPYTLPKEPTPELPLAEQDDPWYYFGWNDPTSWNPWGPIHLPHGGRLANRLFTTDTFPEALRGLYQTFRFPMPFGHATGVAQSVFESVYGLGPSDGNVFTDEQIGLARLGGQFAYLTTRNYHDIGDYNAYFSDEGQARNLSMLSQAGAEIERLSPWTLRGGYQGLEPLMTHIQEDPGEGIIDVALSGTFIGLGVRAVGFGGRLARRVGRGIDPLSGLDYAMDRVDFLTGKKDLLGQQRDATLILEGIGGVQWNPFRRGFGRREREFGAGVNIEGEGGGIATAAHVPIGKDIDVKRVVGHTFSGQRADVTGVIDIDAVSDAALLSTPDLRGLGSVKLGSSSFGRLTNIYGEVGDVLKQRFRSGDSVLGLTTLRSFATESGMGLFTPTGELAGVNLGTLGKHSMFTSSEVIERMMERSSGSRGLGDIDRAGLRSQLHSEGIHFQTSRYLRGLNPRLHSGRFYPLRGISHVDYMDPREVVEGQYGRQAGMALYVDELRQAILESGRHELPAEYREELLGMIRPIIQKERIPEAIRNADIDVVTGVPGSRDRMRERGYNLPDLLGQMVADELGLPFESGLLERTRNTARMSSFVGESQLRQSNVQGSMRVVDPSRVADKRVLGVDDILTTGATGTELQRALMEAGALQADFLGIARAVPGMKIDVKQSHFIESSNRHVPDRAMRELTEEQDRAAGHFEGRGVVTAIPGSGKTLVAQENVRRLVERGVSPDQILSVSFSRAAAGELRDRLSSVGGGEFPVRTMHSMAYEIVQENYGRLGLESAPRINPHLSLSRFKSMVRRRDEPGVSLDPRQSEAVRLGRVAETPEEYATAYQLYKDRYGVATFRDYLALGTEILETQADVRGAYRSRYSHMIVDEAQDISVEGWNFLELLNPNNVFAVGDVHQGIFSFAGASGQALERFAETATHYPLTTNFRSAQDIVDLTERYINPTDRPLARAVRPGGEVRITPTTGETIFDTLGDRMASMAPESFAILTRTNREIAALQREFGLDLERYNVGTVHMAKGREWDNVLVPLETIPITFGGGAYDVYRRKVENLSVDELTAERRVGYVAASRARESLEIMGSGWQFDEFSGLVELHSGRRITVDPDSPLGWNTLNDRLRGRDRLPIDVNQLLNEAVDPDYVDLPVEEMPSVPLIDESPVPRTAKVRHADLYTGSGARDMWRYKEMTQSLEDRQAQAKMFAQFAIDNLPPDLDIRSFDYIAAVPQRPGSGRDFDSFGMIAEEISRQVGVPLYRGIEDTLSYSVKQLSKAERTAIGSDRFKIATPEEIREKKVIAMDDVATTGGTGRAFVGAIGQADPADIAVYTLFKRPWYERGVDVKQARLEEGVYAKWKEGYERALREERVKDFVEAHPAYIKQDEGISSRLPKEMRRPGEFMEGIRTIFASPKNFATYLFGGESGLVELRRQREVRLADRAKDVELHSGQLNLFDFDSDIDAKIKSLMGKVDEHPYLFWRFEDPLEPTAAFSQDYVQTQMYPKEGIPLPDSFVKVGEGPFGSFEKFIEGANLFEAESIVERAYIARHGLYGIPLSEFLSEVPSSQTHRVFKEGAPALRMEEGRSLNLKFGVGTPYQQHLAPSENVFLPLGSLESFPTNIPHGTDYFVDASKGQFVDVGGIELDDVMQRIGELPLNIDSGKLWNDHLRDPSVKSAYRLELEGILNPYVDLHSGSVRPYHRFLDVGEDFDLGEIPFGGTSLRSRQQELTFGIEIETFLPRDWEGFRSKGALGAWKTVHDESLSINDPDYRGIEIVSPILQGDTGLREVEDIADMLIMEGAEFNRTTGTHVHVGAGDLSNRQLGNIAMALTEFERVFDQRIPEHRLRSPYASGTIYNSPPTVETRYKYMLEGDYVFTGRRDTPAMRSRVGNYTLLEDYLEQHPQYDPEMFGFGVERIEDGQVVEGEFIYPENDPIVSVTVEQLEDLIGKEQTKEYIGYVHLDDIERVMQPGRPFDPNKMSNDDFRAWQLDFHQRIENAIPRGREELINIIQPTGRYTRWNFKTGGKGTIEQRQLYGTADPQVLVNHIEHTKGFIDAAKDASVDLHSGTLYPGDLHYPLGLQEAFRNPRQLHFAGDSSMLAAGLPRIAVVGRATGPTDAELKIASGVGRVLAEQGHITVSGFARGTDQAAQLGALRAGGQSIAVLPHGFGAGFKIPKEFEPFVDDQSLLGVTPFPNNAPFSGQRAIMRNKWTTAMSDATIVIGSDLREKASGSYSGTFHTAETALDQGRPLFVVDPSVSPYLPEGNVELIEMGGTPLYSGAELPELLAGVDRLQESGQLHLQLHSGRRQLGQDRFGLSRRLAVHHTSFYNFEEILDTGALLSGRQASEFVGMHEVDKLAGDDQYIFLSKYTGGLTEGELSFSRYGDYGFVFPTDRLVNAYKGQVSDTDLLAHYQLLQDEMAYEWASGGDILSLDQMAGYERDFREGFERDFRERAKVFQQDYRLTGEKALNLFDRESELEILVPNRLPLSEAVGIVEENVVRGLDDAWLDLELHSGDRYLSEHMMKRPHFEQAVDRGYLSPSANPVFDRLYFSEGGHFRFLRSHGFLFDPNVLENEFGAVSSRLRSSFLFDRLVMEEGRIGKQAQKALIGGDKTGSDLKNIWERQTGATFDDMWDMDTGIFVSHMQNFRRETGIGLEWILNEHRRLGLSAEPEFITVENVPLSASLGIIEGGPPELFGQNRERVGVPDDLYGGTEPGSFAGSWGGKSVKLHSGKAISPFHEYSRSSDYVPVVVSDEKSVTKTMMGVEGSAPVDVYEVSPLLKFEEVKPLPASVQRSVVKVEGPSGSGTGFFVDKNIVATNYHVIEGWHGLDEGQAGYWTNFSKVHVPGHGRVTVDSVLGLDKRNDVALIKVQAPEGVSPLTLSDTAPSRDVIVRSLGYPLGVGNAPQFDVGRYESKMTLVEDVEGKFVDAPIMSHPVVDTFNHPRDLGYYQTRTFQGESGSPLFDAKGHVFGQIWGTLDVSRQPSGAGEYTLGTSSRDIQRVLDEVKESGRDKAEEDEFSAVEDVVEMEDLEVYGDSEPDAKELIDLMLNELNARHRTMY